MTSPLIQIEGLAKYFGPLKAVDGVSFTVDRGEVLGFLGPNGAGKSTSMKVLTGFLQPTEGRITINGADIMRDRLKAQRDIGYLPEGAPAYGDMTAYAYLKFTANVRGLSGDEAKRLIDQAVERTQLHRVLHQPIETLSKGFKRRVGLAQSILHDPPVLVLDEPTDGLDPNQKHAVRELIKSMAKTKAIIISTHLLEEVEAVCTRAIIIDRGKLVFDGTPTELMRKSAYHNAVSVKVPAASAAAVKAAFAGIDHVSRIEESADGTSVTYTLVPEDGAILVDKVGELAGKSDWSVLGLAAEPGRLDEVFRNLTTADTHIAANSEAQAQ